MIAISVSNPHLMSLLFLKRDTHKGMLNFFPIKKTTHTHTHKMSCQYTLPPSEAKAPLCMFRELRLVAHACSAMSGLS